MEGKTIAMGSTVELSVPAVKEMMLVVRLTTAAVMARVGINADKMDDMKMAVEEAANCLMQTSCICSLKLSFVRVSEGVSIAVRGGLHCAARAHRTLGTLKTGTVRFSVSPFTTHEEVDRALLAVKRLVGE